MARTPSHGFEMTAPEPVGPVRRVIDSARPEGAGGSRAVDALLGQQISGRPLDNTTRTTMERRLGTGFGDIRLHHGPVAERVADNIGARAFSVGRDIVFGRSAASLHSALGQALLGHELIHSMQQGPQATMPPLSAMTRPSDAVEREAMAGSRPGATITVDGAPRIAREPVDAGAPPVKDPYTQVISLLEKPDPIAGVGDPGGAIRVLEALPLAELTPVLEKLAGANRLWEIVGRRDLVSPSAVGLKAALEGLALLRIDDTQANSANAGDVAGNALVALSMEEVEHIFRFLFNVAGINTDAAMVLDGLSAMMDAAAMDAAPLAMANVTGPIGPGPWAPPGRQWPAFYIGNEAHTGIATYYRGFHLGDAVFTNHTSMASIINSWNTLKLGKAATPGKVGAADLGLEPDIANLTKTHLYEIKSKRQEALGATEAKMYQGLFLLAGIPMKLGPMTEPGTAGGIPAPNGVFLFSASQPGVITYELRRGRLVPVPVPAGEKSKSKAPKFVLEPLPAQAVATVGVAAMLGIILLSILRAAGTMAAAASGMIIVAPPQNQHNPDWT